jgi:hypothetical protein
MVFDSLRLATSVASGSQGISRIGALSRSGKGRYAKFLLAAGLLHPPRKLVQPVDAG